MIRKAFKFHPFSKKQKKLLTWWMDGSPYKDHFGIIADGAIRAGKTIAMSLSFVMWAMNDFEGKNFAMCGKSIGSLKRNVWFWLVLMLRGRGYKVKKVPQIADNCYIITKGDKTNYFYMFGGKDESSQDLIVGLTLAGILFDEVAIMPESFVTQGTGRLSVEGAKAWFNCNPQGPKHWFKTEWIDKAAIKGLLYIHFTMDDNLSLSEKVKERYRSMYTGLFFQRYILGLWKLAEGTIYDMFDESKHTYGNADNLIDPNKPIRRYYVMDYGTINPCAVLEIIEQDKKWYIEDRYYYDSKQGQRQKDDAEYVADISEFIGAKEYLMFIIDPSAASFKIAARRAGIRTRDANNDVLDGIRLVASLFSLNLIKINRDNCKELIVELGAYIWDAKAAERGEEKPIKQWDHLLDALRYFVNTVVRIIPGVRR